MDQENSALDIGQQLQQHIENLDKDKIQKILQEYRQLKETYEGLYIHLKEQSEPDYVKYIAIKNFLEQSAGTSLMHLIQNRNEENTTQTNEIIRALIEAGANVCHQNDNNSFVLKKAVLANDRFSIKTILTSLLPSEDSDSETLSIERSIEKLNKRMVIFEQIEKIIRDHQSGKLLCAEEQQFDRAKILTTLCENYHLLKRHFLEKNPQSFASLFKELISTIRNPYELNNSLLVIELLGKKIISLMGSAIIFSLESFPWSKKNSKESRSLNEIFKEDPNIKPYSSSTKHQIIKQEDAAYPAQKRNPDKK